MKDENGTEKAATGEEKVSVKKTSSI